MWAIVTSAVYHPCMYIYGKNIYLSADKHPTPTEGVIISQPIFRFMGVIFDEDHLDFEGLRPPRAHLDTVLRNLSSHLSIPRKQLTQKKSISSLYHQAFRVTHSQLVFTANFVRCIQSCVHTFARLLHWVCGRRDRRAMLTLYLPTMIARRAGSAGPYWLCSRRSLSLAPTLRK